MHLREDRGQLDIPHTDTAPHLQTLMGVRDAVMGEHSEWDPEEQLRLAPGLDLAIALALEEHNAVQRDFELDVELLTATDLTELVRKHPSMDTVEGVRQAVDHTRQRARDSLRARLEELIEVSRILGISDDELIQIAQDALDADGPTTTNVLPFNRRTNRNQSRPRA